MERLAQKSIPSHRCLSTAERLQQRLQYERHQFEELKAWNESHYRSILAHAEPPKSVPRQSLTVPVGPELQTERRAASRSASRCSSRSRSETPEHSTERRSVHRSVHMPVNLPPREQLAIGRHLDRMSAAEHTELSVSSQPSLASGIHQHPDEQVEGTALAEERASSAGVIGGPDEKAKSEKWEKDNAKIMRLLSVGKSAAARPNNTAIQPQAGSDREDFKQSVSAKSGTSEKDDAKSMSFLNVGRRGATRPKSANTKAVPKPNCVMIPISADATADVPHTEPAELMSSPPADEEASTVIEELVQSVVPEVQNEGMGDEPAAAAIADASEPEECAGQPCSEPDEEEATAAATAAAAQKELENAMALAGAVQVADAFNETEDADVAAGVAATTPRPAPDADFDALKTGSEQGDAPAAVAAGSEDTGDHEAERPAIASREDHNAEPRTADESENNVACAASEASDNSSGKAKAGGARPKSATRPRSAVTTAASAAASRAKQLSPRPTQRNAAVDAAASQRAAAQRSSQSEQTGAGARSPRVQPRGSATEGATAPRAAVATKQSGAFGFGSRSSRPCLR